MRFYEPDTEQLDGWEEWLATRPDRVAEVARRLPPWELLRMRATGHRCSVLSYQEDDEGAVTMTVRVDGKFNAVVFGRRVFGISPDDLTPCELPGSDEVVGAMLTDKDDIEEFLRAGDR